MSRLMALDVGNKRIGVAVSDPLRLFARGLTVITRTSNKETFQAIRELVVEQEVGKLIVGLPLSMNGEVGPQAQAVQKFADKLRAKLEVPIEMWDERLSTASASQVMFERGQSARKQKASIDSVAAAVILHDYMEAMQFRASLGEVDGNEFDETE